jgi:hypothetical protein
MYVVCYGENCTGMSTGTVGTQSRSMQCAAVKAIASGVHSAGHPYEARYTGTGPGRPYLKVCGCGREGLSVASGQVIHGSARHASSKLARSRVGKSVWNVGAQPAETQTPVASRLVGTVGCA